MRSEVSLINIPSLPGGLQIPRNKTGEGQENLHSILEEQKQGCDVISRLSSWPFSHSSCCRKRALRIADAGLMRVCATMQQRAHESIVLSGIHLLGKHFCKVDIKINVQCNI